MGFKQKSSISNLFGSPAKKLKSGGKMISSDKGSSNYMKEDSKSAILAVGDIGKPGYDKYGAELMSTKRARLKREKGDSSSKNQPVDDSLRGSGKSKYLTPKQLRDQGYVTDDKPVKPNTKSEKTSAGPTPTITPKKEVPKETPKSTPKDNTPSAAQTAASKLEARAKTAISKRKKATKTKDGVEAVRNFQAKKEKKASEPKEMSRKEIREAKKKDKASGMSRKEVRANKLKRKASSTRAKTTSKETAAKGGKEAQRLRRKTIRLEKKVAKQEGRVKASKM